MRGLAGIGSHRFPSVPVGAGNRFGPIGSGIGSASLFRGGPEPMEPIDPWWLFFEFWIGSREPIREPIKKEE